MRYIGLDLGTKTMGVSISDETRTIANYLESIRYEDEDNLIEKIKNIASEHNAGGIVLGYPKNMNNTIGPRACMTLEFKTKLESNFSIPIILQDERLSTVSAHNYLIEANMSRKNRKHKVDGLAATIILQTYLDKEKANERRKNDV